MLKCAWVRVGDSCVIWSSIIVKNLNKPATETFGMIQELYKEETVTWNGFYVAQQVQDRHEDVEDDDRAGRPLTSQAHES